MWERVSLLNGIKPDLFVRCSAAADAAAIRRLFTQSARAHSPNIHGVQQTLSNVSPKFIAQSHTVHGKHTNARKAQTLFIYITAWMFWMLKFQYLAATGDLLFDFVDFAYWQIKICCRSSKQCAVRHLILKFDIRKSSWPQPLKGLMSSGITPFEVNQKQKRMFDDAIFRTNDFAFASVHRQYNFSEMKTQTTSLHLSIF